ncbi:MAG: diphthamide biosynthesis enzyme Dph2 [Thermoplasmata archaeon]
MTDMAKIMDAEKQGYDLRLDEVCRAIEDNDYRTIMLQFPEGLKKLATLVKDIMVERTNANVIISADSCFGACDLPPTLDNLGIDLLVQFGHSEMPTLDSPLPTIFIEANSNLDVMSVVKKALEHLNGSVGLITNAQHIHNLEEAKNFLEENGFKVVVGKGSGRIAHDGQVLGCDLSSATSISDSVECYLYIGSGNFHPLGVAIVTKKPVIIADPYLNEVRDIEETKNRLMRQRHGAIAKAKDVKSFGFIVGTKPGQTRLKLAFDLKKLAEKHEKKAYILVLNEFTPMNLKPFKIDAFVSTACPRIAIDDYMMYHVPILTPWEFRIVLGEEKWEDYRFDEFV